MIYTIHNMYICTGKEWSMYILYVIYPTHTRVVSGSSSRGRRSSDASTDARNARTHARTHFLPAALESATMEEEQNVMAEVAEYRQSFAQWLEGDSDEQRVHKERVRDMCRDALEPGQGKGHLRLLVNLNHLRATFNPPTIAQDILRRPMPFMQALQLAAEDVAKRDDPRYEKVFQSRRIAVGFEGRYVSLARSVCSPRTARLTHRRVACRHARVTSLCLAASDTTSSAPVAS